jgi:acetyl esterase/lipase
MAEKETVMNEPVPIMSWPDLTNRPKEEPTETVRIGDGETDIVDVWLPDGPGPHPVVLMVHGGCWQKSIADRTLMNYAAEAMRAEGLAVWNIEYRGVDEEGGGYPGTFQDVAQAADSMRGYAKQFNFDLNRVAGFGHSAGGHLVTWLAGRKNLPATSVLAGGDPLQMLGVVNSGGLADLEASEPLTLKSCLAEIKNELVGEVSDARPDPLSDTSSDRLLPTGAVIYSVNGERDRIAPPALGDDFTLKAEQAGNEAKAFIIPDEGHVELIAPGSDAFDKQVSLLKEILGED